MTPAQLAIMADNAYDNRDRGAHTSAIAQLRVMAERGASVIPNATDIDLLRAKRDRLQAELALVDAALYPVPPVPGQPAAHHPV